MCSLRNVWWLCKAHAAHRINQRLLPLDQLYSFGGSDSAGTGRGATIYTLDSGIRLTHKARCKTVLSPDQRTLIAGGSRPTCSSSFRRGLICLQEFLSWPDRVPRASYG